MVVAAVAVAMEVTVVVVAAMDAAAVVSLDKQTLILLKIRLTIYAIGGFSGSNAAPLGNKRW